MIVKGSKINDRYQIIKTLGEGGMANVYLAYDTILDRKVAVKVLRGDLANDEKFVRRFQREALSASSLSHPNIVEMYDVGEDDGQYYIVMEYVEGVTLKQLLKKRGSLTITEVMDIMSQLTDGMAHAHDSFIIHRDIKPQNIMILENGVIKITDFGIAMALNSTQLTQTNSVMGSVHYLPPEQANGKGSTIKSDIYSMGILMYELLTGGVPYKGDNAVEIALKHLKEPLPSIRKVLPELPQSVENIILKSTAKNPQNRYKDARAMHDDIVTALTDERANEKRYVYPFPENDIENTKVLDNTIKEAKEKEKKEKENEKKKLDFEMREENKKQNKILIILASIFAGLVVITASVVVLLPKLMTKDNIEIPDSVIGLSENDAYNDLVELGFNVEVSDTKVSSDDIEEGHVVRTSPEVGKIVKEGSTVTLFLSSGEGTFEIPASYIGKNYIEVKTLLETNEANVIVETIKVSEDDDYETDTVIDISPKVGEKVKKGATVTIYIPEVEKKYPDFVKENYTVDKVKDFCEENNINLVIKYEETDEYVEGTILYQSRPADSVVVEGITLNITVSTKPEVVEEPIIDEEGNLNIETGEGNETTD